MEYLKEIDKILHRKNYDINNIYNFSVRFLLKKIQLDIKKIFYNENELNSFFLLITAYRNSKNQY